MAYLVRFSGSYGILRQSEPFGSLLAANAYAKEHQSKVPGAAVIAIVELDEDGQETGNNQLVKL